MDFYLFLVLFKACIDFIFFSVGIWQPERKWSCCTSYAIGGWNWMISEICWRYAIRSLMFIQSGDNHVNTPLVLSSCYNPQSVIWLSGHVRPTLVLFWHDACNRMCTILIYEKMWQFYLWNTIKHYYLDTKSNY